MPEDSTAVRTNATEQTKARSPETEIPTITAAPTAPLLEALVEQSRCWTLDPLQPLVAYGGVVALALSGWPEAAITLKHTLDEQVPELPPEGAGSRWPKVTLAAMHEKADAMSRMQLMQIVELCRVYRHRLSQNTRPIEVKELNHVTYCSRSNHRVLARQKLPLVAGAQQQTRIPDEQHKIVQDIIQEFDGAADNDYLEKVNRAGNRHAHYMMPAIGSSLVVQVSEHEWPWLDDFRKDMEMVMPGVFVWFDAACLHVTVRAVKFP